MSQAIAAALFITGNATVSNIIVIEAINGTVSAFTFPALQGVIPTVVDRSIFQQANALLPFARGAATIVGPSAGALVVVTAGAGWALAFDALTYLVAAFLHEQVEDSDERAAGEVVDGARTPGRVGRVHVA